MNRPRSSIDARIAEESGRSLSLQEAHDYLEAPVDEAERAEVLEVARWFRRRYPTAAERLAYVRRAYRRWTASGGR